MPLSPEAASKLNVLHWHVTDALFLLVIAHLKWSSSWADVFKAMSFPLQLESLPQLAQLGSFGASKTYSHAIASECPNTSKGQQAMLVRTCAISKESENEVDVRHIVALAANLSIRIVPEPDPQSHQNSAPCSGFAELRGWICPLTLPAGSSVSRRHFELLALGT